MTEIKRAIALGFFDGVHIGHAALLNRTKQRAEEIGAVPSVLSFDVHPDTLVFGTAVPLINSAIGREDIIRRQFGIRNVVFLHFNRSMMQMDWADFIESLIRELNIGWIVVGHDFCFGYKGQGTAERLKDYCENHGLGCDIIPPVMLDGQIVSSTRIRQLIADGDMEQARRWLGHPHMLSDTVHSGYRLGHRMGTPTINMYFPEGVIVPRHGVYATKVWLEDGSSHIAVTNVGVRPTVSEGEPVNVESHLLDYTGNLYGRQARVEFYRFLRPEQKFESYEALSAQIRHDADEAVLRAVLPQALHRALAPVAEAEVVPDHDMADGQLLHDGLDELPPGDAHGVLGKMQEHDVVDAELPADDVLAADRTVDERHLFMEHQRVRVHVEAQHGGLGPQLARPLLRLVQQRRVADVNPVEKAQRDDSFDLCHMVSSLPL